MGNRLTKGQTIPKVAQINPELEKARKIRQQVHNRWEGH